MYNLNQIREQLQNAEHGSERLQLLSMAIQEADKMQDHYWRLQFRNEFIKESIFHGDSFKAIIKFPEYLQIFDEHPEFEKNMSHDMMWTFKNVLENMPDYYQISRAEIEKYFEEFEKRGRKYGESLRTYYMKKCKFYLPIDLELAKENYEKFRKYPRSSNSDCKACEQSFSMECQLNFGNLERALQLAKPILDGEMTCAEIPHCTYEELAKYYLYHDNLTEAFYYGTLCEKLITGEPEFLEQMGTVLELYSIMDPGHGWNILKYAIPDFVDCKNTLMEVSFARGAYRLMKAISKSSGTDGNPVWVFNASLHLLPIAKAKDGWLAKDIADYFYQIAEDLSQKLDARNQNTHFQDILHTEFSMEKFQAFSESEKAGASPKPAHGITRKEELLLLISVPESQDFKMLAEKIQNDTEKDFKIQVCDPDDADDLYLSVRYEKQVYDMHIIPKPEEMPPVYAKSSYDMPEEQLRTVLESPIQYLLVTEIPGDAMTAYHVYMEIISILFPELLGVVNLHARKAYPPEWVRFAGMFAHAVSPYDPFGIYITGTDDGSDIFMTTCGLCTLGMREMELIGANADNFGYFANMLDYTAARCVERDLLPDAGEIISDFAEFSPESENIKNYQITWNTPEHVIPELPEDSLAVGFQREMPTAVLILTETGTAPAIQPVFTDLDEIHYPSTNRYFHRKIALAKETLGVFRNALEHDFEKAAVRLELDLDDYGYYESEAYENCDEDDEPDYSIELVWADLKRDGDTIRAYVTEEFPTLPDCHAGDEIAFTEENTASWALILPDSEDVITQEEAYLLL